MLIYHLDYNRWHRFPVLTHLVTKVNAVEDETTWADCLYHQRNKSIQCDCVTATTFPASLLQNRSAATDHLCQKALNWKLSREIKRWHKFFKVCKSKQNCVKRNCVQWDLPAFPIIKNYTVKTCSIKPTLLLPAQCLSDFKFCQNASLKSQPEFPHRLLASG